MKPTPQTGASPQHSPAKGQGDNSPLREDELVWQSFDCRREGFFVEVGAHHPTTGSQSFFLEQQGWRGILIEPQPQPCERLRQGRPEARVVQAACGPPGHPPEMPFYFAEAPSHSSLARNAIDPTTHYLKTEMVKVMTLDDVLAQAGNPRVDFVSIDVEGTQLDVLRGFSLERHRPALLLLEDHLHNLATHRYLKQHGYRLVKRTGLNNWYVPKDRPFGLTSPVERLRLWKKVWANTPFRKMRVFLSRQVRRQA
jgi:FkbM family methyltransferase